jgi:hypothetical protein
MNDPDNFLSRWSRRKSGQQRETEGDEQRKVVPAPAVDAPAPEEAVKSAQRKSPPGAEPAAFDPASLPTIESIAADTDISPFLQPGVPADLRNAALRRAWSVDPAIRNFKGLQENDWDFNDPNGIPGFGPLSPDLDVGKMASALFGSRAKESSTPTADPPDGEALADNSAGDELRAPAADAARPGTDSSQDEFVQREKNIATRDENSEPAAKRTRRRGGALPQS